MVNVQDASLKIKKRVFVNILFNFQIVAAQIQFYQFAEEYSFFYQ